MSHAQDAWVSWDHHEGGELRDDDSLPINEIMQAAFAAGWKNAGGDERLAVLEKLNEYIGAHCRDEVGKQFCEDYGCGTLQDLIKDLGGEPHFGE